MAVQDIPRREGPFVGDGEARAYPFPFLVFKETDVRVVRSVSEDDNAGEEELSLGTDYTVSLNEDQETSPGGTVRLTTPLPAGIRLSIVSSVEATQEVVLTNHDGFYPEILNAALDKLTVLAQELQEQTSRNLQVPVTSEKSPSELLSDVMSAKVSADKVIPHIPSIETAADSIDKITTVADNVDDVQLTADNIEVLEKVASGLDVTRDGADVDYGHTTDPLATEVAASGALVAVANAIEAVQELADNLDAIIEGGEIAESVKENADRAEAAAEAAVGQLHAVSYEAQVLKQAERIQAKANIGVDYFVNVRDFGAKGDGVTDDTAAIQAAIDFAAEKGCRTLIPASGAAYVTTASIVVPRGVTVFGDSHNGTNRTGAANTEYAKVGTTINPKGKDGSAFVLAENGASIRGIQFIHDQPVPLDESWAPTQYPYCIEVKASWHTIQDISVVNGTHGIWLSYTPSAPGGTQVTIDNCRIGALEVGLRHDSVTDTLAITRVNFAPCWMVDNPYVKAYRHEHTLGWALGHGSGTYATGIEFYRLHTAMRLRSLPNNVGKDTGAVAGRFDNILFNLVNRAVEVESTTIMTSLNFGTVYAQSTDDWGLPLGADPLFNFQSDNADMSFSRLVVGTCGGNVVRLGAGTGGRLSIADLCVNAYGAQSSGQSAFFLAAGAKLTLGTYTIKKSGSAGAYFSGQGANNIVTGSRQSRVFFPTFNAVVITGDGTRTHITTNDPRVPSQEGWTQVRLLVEANVMTPAAGRASFEFCGVTVQIDISTSGWKTVDSNWVDIPSGIANEIAGRLYVTAPTGTKLSTGSISAQWR